MRLYASFDAAFAGAISGGSSQEERTITVAARTKVGGGLGLGLVFLAVAEFGRLFSFHKVCAEKAMFLGRQCARGKSRATQAMVGGCTLKLG